MPRLGKEWEQRRIEAVSKALTTHGMYKTRIYNIWVKMKGRCLNKKDTRFHDYGGRGIQVCKRWLTFESFYEDMHARYSDELTIDRIDNDGNYCKKNCRWVTRAAQQSNTRRNVYITHNGKTQTVLQWAKDLGIHHSTIYKRINRSGWRPSDALCPTSQQGRRSNAVSLQ
jgi:hypothetical protein